MRNGIEHQPLSEELRVDVAVVKELSEPELALVELGHLATLVWHHPQLTHRGGGDMHQSCPRLQAEFHTPLCTTDIHIFNICAL